MELQSLCNEMASAIENGDYKEITKTEHNGKQEVRVMFNKRVLLNVYEDGNISVRLLLKPEEFPYTYTELLEKYIANFNINKEEKLAKWRAQKEMLEAKIDELEQQDAAINADFENLRVPEKEEDARNAPEAWYKRVMRRISK